MTNIKKIQSQTLVNWLQNNKAVNLLDIRTQAQRNEWRIPKSYHIDAYNELKSGQKKILNNLPFKNNIPIVVVCESGNLSQKAADILTKQGYDAHSLHKGMKAWNYAHDTRDMAFKQFKIIQVRRVAKGCLSYVIGSKKEAIVIDASLDPSIYLNIAKEEGWKIKFVSDTHIHADYVSRSKELANLSGAKHLMNINSKVDYSFIPIKNNEKLKVGACSIDVIDTPGHTWESTSFLVDNLALFTGDTLFTDGIGRPDLKSDTKETIRKAEALYNSLQSIKTLASDTLIFPAHISKSIEIGHPMIVEDLYTLHEIIPSLNFLKEKFIKNILSRSPEPPSNYLTIAAINKSGKIGNFKISELEVGSNRCAI